MKPGTLAMAAAALIETGAASYYLAAQPQDGMLVATLAVHAVAACLCALAGASVTAPRTDSTAENKPRSRAAAFVFYIVPALLLPIGGVATVVAMSLILRSDAKATSEDASPFEKITLASVSRPEVVMLEPLAGALKQLPLHQIRAVATGLRNARPTHSAAAVLQHLQQHDDTEVRFRAQGAVTRALRQSDDCLKQLAGHESLTHQQNLAAADACLNLAEWTRATGSNRNALLENAIGYLADEKIPAIPRLARLVRAQLAARRTDGAADSLAKLRAAGASQDLLSPLQAELLYQQRDWNALAEYCASESSPNPGISAAATRFWRAAAIAG
ncbi:MAG: hypothetical protein KDN22_24975 [Verrucomicrobiae bacterium]|nr:hypothetical protein [Verrucomicrobiae bacterium]